MEQCIPICVSFLIVLSQLAFSGECDNFRELHPEGIFCDDFEDASALVNAGRYFEYNDNGGDFANINGVGLNGSHAMRARFRQGEVDAGSLKLAFGRNPVGYMNKQGIRSDEDAGDSPVITFGGPALPGAIAFYDICFADKGVKARSGRIVKR